jgi:hypothetical protein
MSFLDDASNADDNATVLPIDLEAQPVMYASIQGRVYQHSDGVSMRSPVPFVKTDLGNSMLSRA